MTNKTKDKWLPKVQEIMDLSTDKTLQIAISHNEVTLCSRSAKNRTRFSRESFRQLSPQEILQIARIQTDE